MWHFHAVKRVQLNCTKKHLCEFLRGPTKLYTASVKEMISGVTITPTTCWNVWETSVAPHWDHNSVKRSKNRNSTLQGLTELQRDALEVRALVFHGTGSGTPLNLAESPELKWKLWRQRDVQVQHGRACFGRVAPTVPCCSKKGFKRKKPIHCIRLNHDLVWFCTFLRSNRLQCFSQLSVRVITQI